jgi:TIR domain
MAGTRERPNPDLPIKVFISYRRTDNVDLAGRFSDKLKEHFGDANIFFDVESIPLASDFRLIILDEIARADVLVALIGTSWAAKLEDPNDFVRLEVSEAISRGLPVLPIRLNEAELPIRTDLPTTMRGLLDVHAGRLRGGHDFRTDAEYIVKGIELAVSSARARATEVQRRLALAEGALAAEVRSAQKASLEEAAANKVRLHGEQLRQIAESRATQAPGSDLISLALAGGVADAAGDVLKLSATETMSILVWAQSHGNPVGARARTSAAEIARHQSTLVAIKQFVREQVDPVHRAIRRNPQRNVLRDYVIPFVIDPALSVLRSAFSWRHSFVRLFASGLGGLVGLGLVALAIWRYSPVRVALAIAFSIVLVASLIGLIQGMSADERPTLGDLVGKLPSDLGERVNAKIAEDPDVQEQQRLVDATRAAAVEDLRRLITAHHGVLPTATQ